MTLSDWAWRERDLPGGTTVAKRHEEPRISRPMRDHIPEFKQALSDRRLAPRSVQAYGRVLECFAAFLKQRPAVAVDSVATVDVRTFLARPLKGGGRRSDASHNHELAALRAFFDFVKDRLGWTHNPTKAILFLREPERDPAVLTASEVRRLFLAAAELDQSPRRACALAMLALLSQIGLRVHELAALDLDQLDLPSATLVSIRGKGGTLHDLPLNAPTIALLSAWLEVRTGIARLAESALFVSSRGTRISVRTVERLLERLREAIGTKKHLTPHTLRHSCATLALDLGSDLSTVGELLRHSDINTTRLYVHLVDRRRRDAVRSLGCTIPTSVLPQPAEIQEEFDNSKPLPIRLDGQGDLADNPTLSDSARPHLKPGLTDAAWQNASCGLFGIPFNTNTEVVEGWVTHKFSFAAFRTAPRFAPAPVLPR